MLILEDTRQQENKHKDKHEYFRKHGISWNRTALYCGDYTLPTNQKVCIDTKKDLLEVIGDIQVNTITKKELEVELGKIFEKYNIADISLSEIRDIIWMDDIGRFPEKEINDLCFKNHIQEGAIAEFQKLYVKRRGFFHRGIKRAENSGIQLYILVQNENGIKTIQDVFKWTNPRLLIMTQDKSKIIGRYKNGNPRYARVQKYPRAMRGQQLAKAMMTLEHRYGCKFVFCSNKEAGGKIIELLTVGGSVEGQRKDDANEISLDKD